MTTSANVCLCMMVRNESRVIRRALDSIVGQVDAWSITDTGSTDGTPGIITRYFADVGLPGTLHHTPFVDFGTSRTVTINHALAEARGRRLSYLLLLDADEVLHVRDPDWRKRIDGSPYLLLYDGPIAYRALYLVPTNVDWAFVGRTHEYLAPCSPAPERRHFDGVTLEHLGDGGSKHDKFHRDARLLRMTLAEHPEDARSWFYLGESLLNGDIDVAGALDAYTRRSELGGFEEEAWYAAYRRGQCLERLSAATSDAWPAILAYLRAWQRRPWRSEPVTEVVRIGAQRRLPLLGFVMGEYALEHVVPRAECEADILFVDRALNGTRLLDWTSLCAAEAGYPARAIRLAELVLMGGVDDSDAERVRSNIDWFRKSRSEPPRGGPDQLVDACERLRRGGLHIAATLVGDAAAQLCTGRTTPSWRLDFERSISAWYVPSRRATAVAATNRVIARRDTPDEHRHAARANRRFTVEPLAAELFRAVPLEIQGGAVPPGYHLTNPSLALVGDSVRVVVRGVNYRIRPDGGYEHPGHIETRNFLGVLTNGDTVQQLAEIEVPPEHRADRGIVRGFEDCRLVSLGDGADTVQLIANRSHPADPSRRAMYSLSVSGAIDGKPVVTAAQHLRLDADLRDEKNWMPCVCDGQLKLVYSIDPTVIVIPGPDGACEVVSQTIPPFWCGDLRGGSQLVPTGSADGEQAWLAIVHGVLSEHPGRSYFHAFVLFDVRLTVVGLSNPFVLRAQQVEFAAGCARVGAELLITWGENDGEPWIGRMAVADAIGLCRDGVASGARSVVPAN